MTDVFELFSSKYGSGWEGVHVKLKQWYRPPGFDGCDGLICLTLEAENQAELDENIDELISELQALKAVGRRKFAKLKEAA